MISLLAALAEYPAGSDPAWRDWLDAGEIAYCTDRLRAGEHLVARLLAKRAAVDVLGWTGEIPWRDLTVVRSQAGAPSVQLRGDVESFRRRHNLPVPGVSMTHAGGYAAALAWLPGGE